MGGNVRGALSHQVGSSTSFLKLGHLSGVRERRKERLETGMWEVELRTLGGIFIR